MGGHPILMEMLAKELQASRLREAEARRRRRVGSQPEQRRRGLRLVVPIQEVRGVRSAV
jgi:hypothetical protein